MGLELYLPPSPGNLFSKWIEEMKTLLLRLLLEEDGPTAVEYAVMLMMIMMAAIGAVRVLGGNLNTSFEDSNAQMLNSFS